MVSFEGRTLPAGLRPEGGSRLEPSGERFIDGRQSLAWTWQGDAALVIEADIPYVDDAGARRILGRGAVAVFSAWVYNEQALPGAALRFEFGRAGKASAPACRFDFGLDFTGWRTLAVAFDRDMEGQPVDGMDYVRIRAPEDVPRGRLFLDRFILGSIDDNRHQWPDYQVPFVRNGQPSIALTPLPEPASETVPPAEQDAIDLVAARYEEALLGDAKTKSSTVDALRRRFAELEIAADEQVVRGRHVVQVVQRSVYPDDLDAAARALLDAYVDLRRYTELMLEIAQAYRGSEHPEDAAALRSMFVLMSRHLLDQGWQEGSSLYTTHHFGYSSRSWFAAMFLMRQVLEEEGLLEPMNAALRWYMREFLDFAKMDTSTADASNMDYLNTVARSHLLAILSLPDGAQKTELMRRFAAFLSDGLAAETAGTLGGLKPDGTAFHHGGNYPGYSFPAFNSAAFLCRLMAGTPYAASPDARTNFKRALVAASLYGNPETGLGLCGRHPFGESSLTSVRGAFLDLARCGDPVSSDAVDRELAALYLRLAPDAVSRSDGLFGAEISPAAVPDGHWTFNYGCFGIHRWQGKMVTLKGFNRNVWASEIYTRDNRYGRYQSNGGVQITGPGGHVASGFLQDGWDWNRNPGATVIHLPLDQLESPVRHTFMYRPETTFSGSSHLENRFGLFAAVLRQPDKPNFDPTFRANKSMFCFDNRIVCLGSDIENAAEEFSTETILFQHALEDRSDPSWFGAVEPVTGFPAETAVDGLPAWLMDGHGNGYCIVEGGSVRLSRTRQASRHNKTKAPTEGDFAAAWIDHGPAPQAGGYEYVILLDGDAQATALLARAMEDEGRKPYRVLRRDKTAHVVADRATGVTGYVVFQALEGMDQGPVAAVEAPSLVMTRRDRSGRRLRMSVCDPDLNLSGPKSYTTASPSEAKKVNLTLRGKWRLAGEAGDVTLQVRPGGTRLSVTCVHGEPVAFELVAL